MDKSGDVRRVLSRCSGHNHINSNKNKLVVSELSGGVAIFTAKSRREKLRRLSLVGRVGGGGVCEDDEDTEMGSAGSDGEDELPSSTASPKKLKFHKKISEDSNAVDHASIPRKLRSVIKKRSCHSVSLPLPNPKRINHVNGLQATRKDGLMKSKSCAFACESMTKDEEEVAEALYALAGTAPRKVTTLLNKSDGESPCGKQKDLEKLKDSLLSSQGPEEIAKVNCNLTLEELSKQKMKVDDLGKSTLFSQPNSSEPLQLDMNASSSALQVNHQSLSTSGTKLKDFEQREATFSQRISENTGDFTSQDKQNHASTKSKENGSKLLPGIYSQVSLGPGGDSGFPLQYSAAKIPSWLRTVASSSEPGLHQSQAAHKSDSEVDTCNRKIKRRCATHVYISQFIHLSQNSEGKDISLLEAHQFRPFDAVSNGSTTMAPPGCVCSSFSEKNLLDASNDAPFTPRRLSHFQEPGNSTLRKQCYDFLSLSTEGNGTESKADDATRNGIQLDPLAELPVSKLQQLSRYDSAVSLPLPPNLLPSNLYQHHQLSASAPVASLHLLPNLTQSNAYQNQHSSSTKPQLPVPQVHLQLPPYFSRPIQLDSSATSTAKRPQLQLRPPQEHPIWMAQLAAQYRPGTMTPTQAAHWQNSRQEPQIAHYTQAQITPSQSSPGADFTKYLQMPQQHHQLLHFSPPFPPLRATSHHSVVPISCDKGGS